MTIHEAQQNVAASLRTISDAPELDAQRILLHILTKDDASYLLAHGEDVITEQNLQTILEMAEKRKTGMPLAYILGHADFYGRTFIVTPNVLVPRPDTEASIDTALDYIKNNFDITQEILIADICTGSGIIATTLALELPNIHIIATDISPAALKIAQQNAEKHGVADRIEFLQGDMLSPILNRNVDLIVSNPPYIPTEELAAGDSTQDTRGLLFEPRIALDGGEDGLQFVNQILRYSQENNVPAIIETVGGEIITANKKGE
ncbi:MAG: peptide chain release factor N(5)-glutamine methyltransferase [Candidatus Andersenbacteria bacterium]|nr:peptide chain release factor N(5)-glutamine methyltransferase [Candidatus Andersenbacteria bacterium]